MTWLAAAAALLVAASPSFAPTRGELLGGGSVGTTRTAGHVDVDFTTIRVSKDGKSIHFYGDWPARCTDGRVVTANVDRVVRLQPDGTFLAVGLLSTAAVVGTFELQGRLERKSIGGELRDVGSGTGRSEFTSRGGGSTTCKTPLVSWQVRATPRVIGPPTPKRGAAYFGSNTDTDPIVLRVAGDGRSLVQAGVEFGLDCRYFRFRFASDVIPGARIAGDGSFSTVQRYSSVVSSTRYRGATAHYTATLSGRFGASTVGGSLKVDVRITAKGGAVIDECRSATTFAASV
jgi:hypothetical protein